MSKNKEKNEVRDDQQDIGPNDNAETQQAAEENVSEEWTEISEIDKLKAELAEQQAKYLYLQADYQNYRKRTARDISDVRAHTVADTLVPFLAVADYLAMADNAAEKSDNLEALKQGLKMIIGEFDKALEELGVKRMVTVGEKFDPELHEAMSSEPSDTIAEGHITREWSGGYKIGEKVLRHARVQVSSGKAEETAE